MLNCKLRMILLTMSPDANIQYPGIYSYINDYNVDGPGAKSTAMYNLVKKLLDAGEPIDGIGIQAHLILGIVGFPL